MSEAAPGYPDEIAYVSPERARLAAVMRRLIDAAMTTPDATPAALTDAASQVEAAIAALGADDRPDAPGYTERHGEYLPRSPVVGEASPLAPGTIDWQVVDRDDGEGVRVLARGTIGAAYEGPPGCVHGGIIALCFDEMLGIVNIANQSPGMTGTLTVKYRSPTPLFAELRWDAWVERQEGRRTLTRGTLHCGDRLCAEAEGLFIQPRPGSLPLPGTA